MADLISADEISRLMTAFAQHDSDNDGVITTPQLRLVLRSLGHNPTEAELQDLAYAMDTNESGTIDLTEFLHGMAVREAESNAEEEILEAFKVFDKDGDGLISARELKHVMANMGEALTEDEVDSMIAEADQDGDGCINYTEFFVMVSGSLSNTYKSGKI